MSGGGRKALDGVTPDAVGGLLIGLAGCENMSDVADTVQSFLTFIDADLGVWWSIHEIDANAYALGYRDLADLHSLKGRGAA